MKLCLIDGYNFVFRAYHSLPALSTKDGTPIGAVYGFVNMLYKLILNHESDMLAVVLDAGKKTFRHDIFPEYKSNRPAPPEELKVQFPIIREVIKALNIKSIEKIGFEADDLIASYAKKAVQKGYEVKIIASDKDLIQLMDDKVVLFDPIKQKEIDDQYVLKRYGVKSEQMVDFLALIGDSADYIPGVRGVGAKTAAKLLTQYSSLDNIYDNISNIDSKRVQGLLVDGKKSAFLSKELIILKTDFELPLKFEELKYNNLDKEVFKAFLEKYGFHSILNKLSNETTTSKKDIIPIEINTKEEFQTLIPDIKKTGIISIAFMNNVPSIFFDNNLYLFKKKGQLELLNQNNNVRNNIDAFYETLKVIWEDDSILKICMDAKSFYKTLRHLNINFFAYDDIALMSYSLDTGKHNYDLKTLIDLYSTTYIKEDAYAVFCIYEALRLKMFHEKKFTFYENIEKPLIKLLADMELRGIKVSKEILMSLSKEFYQKLDNLTAEIYKIVGFEFNIGSPKQIGEVLFDKLGIQGGKKSKKSGSYVTSVEVLQQLSERGFEIVDKILEWRHYSKLINTYTEALQKSINPITSRVHTVFSMTGTSTGRLSSHDPNLQNIPIRTDEGNKIRSAFIAQEGCSIVCADYSQIELRVLAYMAGISELKSAFEAKQDIHSITASQMFKVPLKEVDEGLRRKAKAINFGIIYGISPFGLARNIGISKLEAKVYIENYFNQYPGIKQYMEQTIKYAKTHGYVKTLMQRKCFVQGINDRSYTLRSFAERAAINAPIQGTASDIIKTAMVNLPYSISKYLLLQVHDELLFEIPNAEVTSSTSEIKRIMEDIKNIGVPLVVDIKNAASWNSK